MYWAAAPCRPCEGPLPNAAKPFVHNVGQPARSVSRSCAVPGDRLLVLGARFGVVAVTDHGVGASSIARTSAAT